MPATPLHIRLYRAWRIIMRRLHVISGTYDTGISLTETHTLVELDADGSKTSQHLASILNLDKATFSRILSGMLRRKLLKVERHKHDRRSKKLIITAQGHRALAEVDKAGNRFIAELASDFSTAEEQRFFELVREFADFMGAAPGVMRASDHPLRTQLRRMARCFGMLGTRLRYSSLNVTEEQTLNFLLQRTVERPSSLSEIATALSTNISTLSRSVRGLEAKGMLKRAGDKRDARRQAFSITAQGLNELREIEKRVGAVVNPVLAQMKLDDAEQLVNFIERYAGAVEAPRQSSVVAELSVMRLHDESRLHQARVFLLENMFALGRHHELPASIFGSDSKSFGLYLGERLCGVCEAVEQRGAWQLLNAFVPANLVKSPEAALLLQRCRDDLATSAKAKSLLIPSSSLLAPAAQVLGAQRKRDGFVLVP